MQCVLHSATDFKVLQYNTIQYNTPHYSTNTTLQYNTIHQITAQHDKPQRNATLQYTLTSGTLAPSGSIAQSFERYGDDVIAGIATHIVMSHSDASY